MIYVATDDGVFIYQDNRFLKIDIENTVHKDTLISFDDIQEVGNYLMIKVNYDMSGSHGLYLLDKNKKKLTLFIDHPYSSIIQIPEYDLMLCTGYNRLDAFSLTAAAAGKVKPIPLPPIYQPLSRLFPSSNALSIDKGRKCLEYQTEFNTQDSPGW